MSLRDILDQAADGPWDWMGGYPQRVTNGGADLVAEVFDDPDSPPGTVRLVALAPELAALCLDMGDFLRDAGFTRYGDEKGDDLLARLARIGET